MNKVIISTAILAVITLTGCNTVNDTAQTGLNYTAATVGTGVRVVSNTGAAVGQGIGGVIETGANVVTGKPVTHHNPGYRTTSKIVYRNGHHYTIQKGRYVRMD